MNTTLSFNEVWKAYPRWDAGSRTLKGVLVGRRSVQRSPERWALRDVSFQLEPGSSTALIGQNGAGKSTLLRLAAGISSPTRGAVAVQPDCAAVLSLGATFDPNLTGVENAVTAAIVAGLSPGEARERLPAMLEFAELESFAEAPLRTYSDGMKLRLAFAAVAQLEPSALLLDEVLAVGDLRFQEKCMARIAELRSHGTSVLLASHSLDQVIEECDTALWLQDGAVRKKGEPAEVVAAYRDAMHAETAERTPEPTNDVGALRLQENRFGSQEATIEGVTVEAGERLAVAFTVRATRELPRPIVGIAIHRAEDGVVCCDLNSESDGIAVPNLSPGRPLEMSLELDPLELDPGRYWVDVGLYESGWKYAFDYHWHAHELVIHGTKQGDGVFRPAGRRWRISD
jgi:lipopolysaccharide transport system ATP-binding protein